MEEILKKYEITKNGEIINKKTNKEKYSWVNNRGYKYVCIQINNKRKNIGIHRLVAEVYLEKVNGKNMINHKNGNKLDNRVENLEWCDKSDNAVHATVTGLRKTKLSKEDVIDIYYNLTIEEAMDKYKIAKTTYRDIKNLKYKSYKLYIEGVV